jgi:hypothetical protein
MVDPVSTNALDLVPAFSRQIRVYNKGTSGLTESGLAGYIADGVQALMYRWDKPYSIDFISPMTYNIVPAVAQKDIRPIVLMASIIYKMGSIGLVAFSDGDFSYNPSGGKSALEMDRLELLSYIPSTRLAAPSVGPLFGYKAIWNPENYDWFNALFFITR